MFIGSDAGEYFEIEVLDYEYPPGWGTGTSFETDWLIVDLNIGNTDGEELTIEGSFIRYSELEAIHQALDRLALGEQNDYEARLMSPNISFSAKLDQGNIYASFAYRDEEDQLEVCEEMLPDRFKEFQQSLEEILTDYYRPELQAGQ